MSKKFPEPNPKTTTAFRDLVIISAIFILVSVLVDFFRVFATFQEWVREQPRWSEWRIHDYLFTIVILALALGVFSLRRWRESRREITERKRMEETLKKSEKQLSVAQDVASLGSWDADLVSNTVLWSPQLYRMLDIDPQQGPASLETFIGYIHPDDRESIKQIIEQALRDGKSFELEHRAVRKDGSVRNLWAKGFVSRDEFGRPTRVFGIEQDITERKKAEEERERLILELKDALANVTQLGKLLPICASCKKIRDDKGYWTQVEKYVMDHSDATFSHGVCPECMQKLYSEYYQKTQKAADGES